MVDLPDWAIETALALGSVVVMFGVLYLVGATFSTNGGLSPFGGLMVIGAIVLFILLMAGIGVVLAYTDLTDDAAT
ncbi:MAG: hypothetical protein ACLFR6_01655 [Salinarchaeum sp.]